MKSMRLAVNKPQRCSKSITFRHHHRELLLHGDHQRSVSLHHQRVQKAYGFGSRNYAVLFKPKNFHFSADLPTLYRSFCTNVKRTQTKEVAEENIFHEVKALIEGGRIRDVEYLFASLFKSNTSIHINTINLLLEAYSKETNIPAMLNLVKTLESKSIAASGKTYAIIMSTYAKKGDLSSINEWLSKMTSTKLQPSITLYNLLLDQLYKSGHMNQMLKMFSKIRYSTLVHPDIVTYNTVLHCYAQRGMLKEMNELFTLLNKKMLPDPYTYTAFITAHAKRNEPSQMMRWYNEMKEKGIHPNVETFTVLISAFDFSKTNSGTSSGRGVEWLLNEMKECGVQVSEYTFGSLINKLLEQGMKPKAKELFKAMNTYSIKPTTAIFNNFIQHSKSSQELQQLYEEMQRCRCQPNLLTFNIIISKTGNSGDIQEMFQWFSRMIDMNIQPKIDTFNTLLSAVVKHGKRDEVLLKHTIEHMIAFQVTPDEVTYAICYNLLKKSLAEGKKPPQAVAPWISELTSRKKNSVYTYNLSIEIKGLLKQKQEMIDIYEQMKNSEVSPNVVTFGILLTAFSSMSDTDSLIKYFKEMKQMHIIPDADIYNIMINGFANTGNIEEILKLFEEMKSNRIQPTVVTYNTIIKAFLAKKDVTSAQSWFNELLTSNMSPTVVTFNMLLNYYGDQGDIQQLRLIHSLMKQHKISPTHATCFIITKALSLHDTVDNVKHMLEEMKLVGITLDTQQMRRILSVSNKLQKKEAVQFWRDLMQHSSSSKN